MIRYLILSTLLVGLAACGAPTSVAVVTATPVQAFITVVVTPIPPTANYQATVQAALRGHRRRFADRYSGAANPDTLSNLHTHSQPHT